MPPPSSLHTLTPAQLRSASSPLTTHAIPQNELAGTADAVAAQTLPVTVWLVDDELCAPYSDYLRTCGEDALYHSLAWRQALEHANFGTPLYLLAMRGDEPVGVLPLMQQELARGRRWSSLPGTPAAGPLAADAEAVTALTERALTLAFARGGRLVTAGQWSVPTPADHERRPRWLRAPLRSLAAYARDTATPGTVDASACHSAARIDETQCLLCGPAGGRQMLDLVLKNLGTAGGHPRHVLTHGASGGPPEMTVWLTRGRTAYLLGYRCAPSATARRELFSRTVERLATEGAEQVDLALPETPDSWSDGLMLLPGVCVAREQPLTAPTSAFQPTR